MKITHSLLALGAIIMAGASGVSAGIVDEARLGVMDHNVCIANCKNADKEDGPNITGELLFKSPDFLSILLEPRPYVLASINTAGDTSYIAGGLEWSWEFLEGWSIEPGLGYAIHDGKTSNPYPNATPEAATFADEHLLLGSRDLFRTSLGLKWQITETWGAELLYDHLSHGQILGTGRNQGIDNYGLRVTYNFD